MRTTTRSSRIGSSTHNDRTYLPEAERPKCNKYGCIFSEQTKTFEEAELLYYKKKYSKGLNAKNERYKKQGHSDRCKTIKDVYNSDKTCPTETLFQIGNFDETVDPEILKKCYLEYLRKIQDWSKAHGEHFHVLNYAMHFDEDTPHVHERSILDVKDKYGYFTIAQEKALKMANIELPEPNKPEGRYNNRKITFDKMRREMFQEICLKHGLNITVEPLQQRKKHKSIHQYKREQLEKVESLNIQKTFKKER